MYLFIIWNMSFYKIPRKIKIIDKNFLYCYWKDKNHLTIIFVNIIIYMYVNTLRISNFLKIFLNTEKTPLLPCHTKLTRFFWKFWITLIKETTIIFSISVHCKYNNNPLNIYDMYKSIKLKTTDWIINLFST